MTRRSLVRTLARLVVNDSARDLARCVAAKQERAVSARLYSTRDRDVLAVPKEAPGPLSTVTGRVTHGGTREQHGQ